MFFLFGAHVRRAADVPCVSLAASKAISLGILAAGMIIKVPQILVILKNRRAMVRAFLIFYFFYAAHSLAGRA